MKMECIFRNCDNEVTEEDFPYTDEGYACSSCMDRLGDE